MITVIYKSRMVIRGFKAALLLLFITSGQLQVCAETSGTAHAGKKFLPIVMTPLKGYSGAGIPYLTWSSLQESNSSHFEIQRSSDGLNFYNTGSVMAQRSSDKVVEYSFRDAAANEGTSYYRLKYFDNDGHYQFSNTIVLTVRIRGIHISAVYPAPFTDKVSITIASEVKTRGTILLFDNTGRMLFRSQPIMNKGVTTHVIDKLNNLADGVYIIKVQAGETILTQKLIK